MFSVYRLPFSVYRLAFIIYCLLFTVYCLLPEQLWQISAAVELKDKEITMFGDAEFQLAQVEDLLRGKLTKRNVDVRFLDIGKAQKIGGDKVKQVIKVRNGIDSELAKKLQRLLKDSKIKVQAAIQEEKVRVSGTKRDDLQAAMALIRKDISDMPLSFNNFRD